MAETSNSFTFACDRVSVFSTDNTVIFYLFYAFMQTALYYLTIALLVTI